MWFIFLFDYPIVSNKIKCALTISLLKGNLAISMNKWLLSIWTSIAKVLNALFGNACGEQIH